MVEQPAKVMRIGTMIKQLLEEVRAAPLDEASRSRLKEIHENSIKELEEGLAPELREELHRLSLPFTEEGIPSDAELRIAQAQLVGWLEGLFHGIQTALFAQQMAARAQLEQMRRGLPPGAGGQQPDGGLRPGHGPVPLARAPLGCRTSRGYPRSVAQAMTTGDAAVAPPVAEEPGPRSWRRAFDDLRGGWRQRPLWGYLGWQDIKQRYRRSVLGPLWISITHGRHRHGHGHPLRGAVPRADPDVPAVRRHGPADLELHQRLHPRGQRGLHRQRGADPVPARAAHLHVYRLVWRQTLFFPHNLVIWALLMIIFHSRCDWSCACWRSRRSRCSC